MPTPYRRDWITEASKVLGVTLKRHTMTKACGPCPHCHAGTDRLVVWEDGGYWCNQCHRSGWWLPVEDGAKRVAEARVLRIEEQNMLLARMAACTDWQAYHKALLNGSGAHLGDWFERGMSLDEIEHWGLGWCEACPLCRERASLTIPAFKKQALVDIRHRLIGAAQGDKYRSHVAGLIPSIFNADALLADETVVIVEGEIKAIASVRAGFPASLGMPGAQFGEALLDVLHDLDARQRVIVALDPDKALAAEKLALQIGATARVADFPAKPDDFLVRYGPKAYAEVIRQARLVRARK